RRDPGRRHGSGRGRHGSAAARVRDHRGTCGYRRLRRSVAGGHRKERRMSPLLKYSLARLGLFLAAAVLILAIPIELNLFLRLAIALIVSALLSFVLLRSLRDRVADQLADKSRDRAQRKERLRSALAGDDQEQ